MKIIALSSHHSICSSNRAALSLNGVILNLFQDLVSQVSAAWCDILKQVQHDDCEEVRA